MRIFHDGLEHRSQMMLRQATKAVGIKFSGNDNTTVTGAPKTDTFLRTTPVTVTFNPRIESRLRHHSVDEMTQQVGAVASLMSQELTADNVVGYEHKMNGFNSDDFVIKTKSGAEYRIHNNVSNGSPQQQGNVTIARVILGTDSSFQELRQEIKLTYGLNDRKPDLATWSNLSYYENTHNRPSGIAGGIESRFNTQSLSPENIRNHADPANTLYFETQLGELLANASAALTPKDTTDTRSLLDPARKWRYPKASQATNGAAHAGFEG